MTGVVRGEGERRINVPLDLIDEATPTDAAMDEEERERQVEAFVAWSDQITRRELERRVRYLLSAMSPDQIAHPA